MMPPCLVESCIAWSAMQRRVDGAVRTVLPGEERVNDNGKASVKKFAHRADCLRAPTGG
jgi:hypothetical protein